LTKKESIWKELNCVMKIVQKVLDQKNNEIGLPSSLESESEENKNINNDRTKATKKVEEIIENHTIKSERTPKNGLAVVMVKRGCLRWLFQHCSSTTSG